MSAAITALTQCFKIILSGMGTVLEGLKTVGSQIGPAFESFKAIISIALTKLFAVCLSLMYTFNAYVAPPTDDVIKSVDASSVRLTIAAIADPQISNYMPKRDRFVRAAGDDLKNAAEKIDALILAGDIAENGLDCEYDAIYNNLSNANVANFIMATGNHDVRLRKYSETVKKFSAFTNRFNENAGSELVIDSLHYSYEINGYNFIVMGTDRTEFEEAYFNDEQLNWLDSELSRSTAQGKPAFVIIHQTLKNMHGLPDTWNSPIDAAGSVGVNSDELYEIMNRYDNVIMISGHLHTGFGKYTYEMAGKVHSVNLPSITIENKDGDYNHSGIGYMIEVYDDEVLFRARHFSDGKYVPDHDFKIDIA